MHTSGHVFTLCANPEIASQAKDRLVSDSPFQLGECVGTRLPAVLEAPNSIAAQHWHDWAADLPGVEYVEVVFVHWDHATAGDHHVLH
jgi:hypothetical protein